MPREQPPRPSRTLLQSWPSPPAQSSSITGGRRTIQVDPHSRGAQVWDVLSATALLSVAVATPFEVAFLETPTWSAWWWFNRVIGLVRHQPHSTPPHGRESDACVVLRPPCTARSSCVLQIFGIDMLLQFVTPFQDRHRVWVTQPSRIVAHYLKGWFLVDLVRSLAAVPQVAESGPSACIASTFLPPIAR